MWDGRGVYVCNRAWVSMLDNRRALTHDSKAREGYEGCSALDTPQHKGTRHDTKEHTIDTKGITAVTRGDCRRRVSKHEWMPPTTAMT